MVSFQLVAIGAEWRDLSAKCRMGGRGFGVQGSVRATAVRAVSVAEGAVVLGASHMEIMLEKASSGSNMRPARRTRSIFVQNGINSRSRRLRSPVY